MTDAAGPMARSEAAAMLGVDPAAARPEVQRAFLRAARRVHPDTLPQADEAERRAAADAFDRLLRARDVLLIPAPPSAARTDPEDPRFRPTAGRGIGRSLVVLALLAFLLVLLVTVQQSIRVGPTDPGSTPSVSPASP